MTLGSQKIIHTANRLFMALILVSGSLTLASSDALALVPAEGFSSIARAVLPAYVNISTSQ